MSDADAARSGGFTALRGAAVKTDADLCRLLLAYGADASLATDEGDTALAIATRSRHHEVAGLLTTKETR